MDATFPQSRSACGPWCVPSVAHTYRLQGGWGSWYNLSTGSYRTLHFKHVQCTMCTNSAGAKTLHCTIVPLLFQRHDSRPWRLFTQLLRGSAQVRKRDKKWQTNSFNKKKKTCYHSSLRLSAEWAWTNLSFSMWHHDTYDYRRKFRSETSDNMDVEKQRWEESEEIRSEERRCRCAKR